MTRRTVVTCDRCGIELVPAITEYLVVGIGPRIPMDTQKVYELCVTCGKAFWEFMGVDTSPGAGLVNKFGARR